MGKTAGAIAAKFAFPDRVSVAMVGDGAMQMGGMAELLTAAKYYKTSADPQLVVLILNNEDLNGMTKAFVAAPKEGLPGPCRRSASSPTSSFPAASVAPRAARSSSGPARVDRCWPSGWPAPGVGAATGFSTNRWNCTSPPTRRPSSCWR